MAKWNSAFLRRLRQSKRASTSNERVHSRSQSRHESVAACSGQAVCYAAWGRHLRPPLADILTWSTTRSPSTANAELTRLLNVARAMGIGAPKHWAWLDRPSSTFRSPGPSPALRRPCRQASCNCATPRRSCKASSSRSRSIRQRSHFADQTANVSSFTAEFNGGPTVTGSASFPLVCATPETCILALRSAHARSFPGAPQSIVESAVSNTSPGITCWPSDSGTKMRS